RSMTPDMAARLGAYFQVPGLWFLQAQARWDAFLAEREGGPKDVERCPRLDEAIVTPEGVIRVRKVERSKPLAPWLVTAAFELPKEPEGTRVVVYPNGAQSLEHR